MAAPARRLRSAEEFGYPGGGGGCRSPCSPGADLLRRACTVASLRFRGVFAEGDSLGVAGTSFPVGIATHWEPQRSQILILGWLHGPGS